MKTSTLAIVAAAFATLLAIPAAAQAPAPGSRMDGRWTPWLGCWRLAQDTVSDTAGANAAAPGMTVCVTPSGTGVMMTTLADGKSVLEQTIVADGAPHALTEPGCAGTQRSDWSRDGERLFTTVEMSCNNRPPTKATGVTLFAIGPAWVDVQAMATDGGDRVRIRRYERTGEGTPAAADSPVGSFSLEDVTEANAKISPAALEAALVETSSRFTLNSKALVQLANAGVSADVIDLMVAQSFPEHFRVDRPAPVTPQYPVTTTAGGGTTVIIGQAYPAQYPYGVYDPYYYNYYYYSPFAYPYYIGNNYYINNGGNYIGSGAPGGSATSNGSNDRGQVVNGRGYTHVRPSDGSTPDAPSQQTPSAATPARSAPAADPTPASGSTSGGSTGGVSNSGYSGGNSGGSDSGRTAQPR